MSQCWLKSSSDFAATEPLPKKTVFMDILFVIETNEFAVVVEFKEGFGVVFNVVDENNTVCMVDFVLEDAGQETFGADTEFAALNIESFDLNFLVALYLAINIFNAEASFVIFNLLAVEFSDLGVNKGCKG